MAGKKQKQIHIDEILHDPTTGEVLDHKGRRLTQGGAEIPDPTPIAPPLGYVKQPTMAELIRSMVKSEVLRQEVEALGAGSFEDEDDFDCDDDYDPTSPYENEFEPPVQQGGDGGPPPSEAPKAAEPPPAEPLSPSPPPPAEQH